MKSPKKEAGARPAAPRLGTVRAADADALGRHADDWTERSVERCTVGPLAAAHAVWHDCLFRGVVFSECKLHGAQLSDIRFEGCDLSNARSPRCGAQPRGVRRLQTAGRRADRRNAQPRACRTLQRPLPQPLGQPPAAGAVRRVRSDRGGVQRLPASTARGSTGRCSAAPNSRTRRCAGSTCDKRSWAICGSGIDDLRGAIVAPMQALDLLPLLGVVVRTQSAEESD